MNEKGSGPNLGKTFATALFSILLVVLLIGGLTYYSTKAINNANLPRLSSALIFPL